MIRKNFPNLTSLKLIAFSIKNWDENSNLNFNSETYRAIRQFFEAVSTISSLNTLFLTYNVLHHLLSVTFPSEMLAFLDDKKLPNLRRLFCPCFDIQDCLKVFAERADKNPKQTFEFMIYRLDGSYPIPTNKSSNVRISSIFK